MQDLWLVREMDKREYADTYLQQWQEPLEPIDALIAKRVEFHQRFAPEAAERHWNRWLEQRAAIDREFDRQHPYWKEHVRDKGWG